MHNQDPIISTSISIILAIALTDYDFISTLDSLRNTSTKESFKFFNRYFISSFEYHLLRVSNNLIECWLTNFTYLEHMLKTHNITSNILDPFS